MVVQSWSSLTENTQITVSFHYSCQTRFFGKCSFNVYVADIQRQIVLKFQIYPINSFENIMVESCRKLAPSSSFLRRPESTRENAWGLDFNATPTDKS